MSKMRIIMLACAITIVVPLIASAQTVSSLEQELQSLLTEIAQLQASASSSAASDTAPTDTTVSTPQAPILCPTLVRTLSLGSTGTDVANLQSFLAQNPLIYPEQAVTGYFGMLTQDAVERWQSAYGVVSSGSPATTGYGVVGARTRAAMTGSCINNSNQSSSNATGLIVTPGTGAVQVPTCPVAPQPSTPCAGTWSNLTNANGCTIAWQCSVPLPTASSTQD